MEQFALKDLTLDAFMHACETFDFEAGASGEPATPRGAALHDDGAWYGYYSLNKVFPYVGMLLNKRRNPCVRLCLKLNANPDI